MAAIWRNEKMAIIIQPAQEIDIPDIVKVMEDVGLSLDQARFANYFFKSERHIDAPGANGGFVVRDGDKIVGYSGLTPCSLFDGKEEILALQSGVLGLKPGYGTAMFDLMDVVIQLTRLYPFYGNTANEKSSALWTKYAGFRGGPENGAYIQFEFLPSGLWTRAGLDTKSEFAELVRSDFWERFLLVNEGYATDRSPARLRRLFEKPVADGRVGIILERQDGRIVGYAILRARQFLRTWKYRYDILDIVALKNDDRIVAALIAGCKRYAARHGGVLIEYVGGLSVFPHRRKALSNTFVSSHAIEGWFYGPYDGDRCLV